MSETNILESLQELMIELNEEKVINLVEQALADKLDPFSLIDSLSAALNTIGERFSEGNCFIPELIKSGQIFEKTMAIVEPELKGKKARESKGLVIVGTVKGDLHDLGLKLVSLTLSIAGFEIINLGKDIPTETFIDKVKELNPQILGLSALLTTTLEQQNEVIKALKDQNLRDNVKVMIGGAPVTQNWADSIGADCVGFDAIDALEKARTLI